MHVFSPQGRLPVFRLISLGERNRLRLIMYGRRLILSFYFFIGILARMNKKIIITATFRDFNGNSNDKIQRLFLKSIKNQTNQNYLLAVTLFGEKNVTNVLTEEKIPFITFQGDAGEHRYSLTQVLLNGIKAAKENKDSIILWTTCDVIFDPDFFEKIVAKTKSRTCGTSYPHLTYPSVDDYKGKRNGHLLWYGIDSIFYSSDVFTEPAAEEALKKYPSEGWGHGDFFLPHSAWHSMKMS